MSRLLDVYAMTNPALCSLVLWSFLSGHGTMDGRGAEFPLLFLPIPLVLSDDLRAKFQGTNARTSFYDWVQRNPEITIGLGERVERTATYSREGILFGARYRLLVGDGYGGMRPEVKVRDSQIQALGGDLRSCFGVARRFGRWVADVGSTRMVLHTLGLTL
ncbi:three component ABC system middle component [Archangium gephyra]|uniref:three component ABC system middle component n=1 Tax=Archangium gephyra TaxID=48 RepID=UPI003B7FB218